MTTPSKNEEMVPMIPVLGGSKQQWTISKLSTHVACLLLLWQIPPLLHQLYISCTLCTYTLAPHYHFLIVIKNHKNLATTPLSHFSRHFQPYHFGCHEWLSTSSSHAFQCPFFDSLSHTTWVINQNTTSPTFLCDLSLVVLVFWKPKAMRGVWFKL